MQAHSLVILGLVLPQTPISSAGLSAYLVLHGLMEHLLSLSRLWALETLFRTEDVFQASAEED